MRAELVVHLPSPAVHALPSPYALSHFHTALVHFVLERALGRFRVAAQRCGHRPSRVLRAAVRPAHAHRQIARVRAVLPEDRRREAGFQAGVAHARPPLEGGGELAAEVAVGGGRVRSGHFGGHQLLALASERRSGEK